MIMIIMIMIMIMIMIITIMTIMIMIMIMIMIIIVVKQVITSYYHTFLRTTACISYGSAHFVTAAVVVHPQCSSS